MFFSDSYPGQHHCSAGVCAAHPEACSSVESLILQELSVWHHAKKNFASSNVSSPEEMI